MSYALMTSTQITYQMTVTVTVNVNADKTLFFLLTCLAYVIWKLRGYFYQISLLRRDIAEAVAFTTMVVIIAFKAILYGVLGVRL